MIKFRLFLITVLVIMTGLAAQNLRPYILIAESDQPLSMVSNEVQTRLEQNDFRILGQYHPAEDQNRLVLVIGGQELEEAVSRVGGLTGFAAALRLGITRTGEITQISCVNPLYQGNAYFQDRFPDVEPLYASLTDRLHRAVQGLGQERWTEFGSEDGIAADDLWDYHYMFGMEYFDDVVTLKRFNSFVEAVRTIESNLTRINGLQSVYSVEIPERKLKLYGVALEDAARGEAHFLPIIDITEPKHTAFLPYEILVNGTDVVMLHGRYRIALSFPDLTMMTFGKIMSTPGDIEDLMKTLVE